jgi:iron complex outermembrane receptor protein
MKYDVRSFVKIPLVQIRAWSIFKKVMKGQLLIRGFAATLVAVGISQAATVENTSEAPPLVTEVVVTATRLLENISEVPAYVTVITEQDIKKTAARGLPDLLRNQAGLHVNDITGNGRNFTVDIRGFGETAGLNTLVLVDGRRINQADLSGTDWTLIPLERIRKVEIIRGGRGSILYGDNASGGVINIITKEGETFQADGKIVGGSYNTFRSEAAISGALKELTYNLSANYANSDGYRDNSDTDAKDIGLNLGYPIGDRAGINFSTGYHDDSAALPGALKESDFAKGISRTETVHPSDFADVEDYYFQGGPEILFFEASMFKLDASFRKRNSLSFASFEAGTFLGDTEIETIVMSPRIILEENIMGFDNSLIIGFDYTDITEKIHNESVFFGTVSIGVFELVKKNYGYYLHEEFGLTDRVALSAGYRYDEVEYSFNPSIPAQTKMDANLFTTGVNYVFFENSSVYLNFIRSFRYPVFDELFSFFTNTLNTSLNPQISRGYEFGITHYFKEDFSSSLNYSRFDTKDELFYNPASFANENMDGTVHRDIVTISLRKTFENLEVNGSYTYSHAIIESGQFADNDFPDVPKHAATLNVQFNLWKDVTMGMQGFYIGKRPFISDFANVQTDQDDYFVVNAKLAYQLRKFSFFADLNNITNEEYSEFGGLDFLGEKGFFPSPEFNFLVGIRASF